MGLAVDTTDILMASWRDNTKGKYDTYFRQWSSFCAQHHLSVQQASVAQGLAFLTQKFREGLSYSSIKGARSALSAILHPINGIPFGKQPLVTKFLRGVANLRPSLAKYSCVWEVKSVLDFFRSSADNASLTLMELTHKLVMLLTLTLCQRAQTIHSFELPSLKIGPDGFHVGFPTRLKQTRPGFHLKPVFVRSFPQEPKLCPLRALQAYIARTSELRKGEAKLLLSYIRPHRAVSSKTVSRWLKSMLAQCGIDVSLFQGHSVRHAGTSTAKRSGVPIANILQMAGWTSEETFSVHYDKPLMVDIPHTLLSA